MKSKALSMKRLYMLAGNYVSKKYAKRDLNSGDISKQAHSDLAELNSYLRYVWENRNK
jgi:hypothetical protein